MTGSDKHTRARSATFPAAVILLACCLAAGGCRDQTPVAEYDFLDPPQTAAGRQAADLPGNSGIPVLCYHYFRADLDPAYLAKVGGSLLFGLPALGTEEFWTTPIGEFAWQLEYLAESGVEVLTLDEVAALAAHGDPLPERAVVLTVDDAERSFHRLAFPLLRRFGVRAHLFVPTSFAGGTFSGLDICSWDELREMQDSGLVILGSHTNRLHYKVDGQAGRVPVTWEPEYARETDRLLNLKELAALAGAQAQDPARGSWQALRGGRFGPVTDDLLVSRAALVRNTGAPARWLAWPFGFGNGDLDSVARAVGFAGTVSLHRRTFEPGRGPWHVGRYTVTAHTTREEFKQLIERLPGSSRPLAHLAHP
ncbi:MAG: polysaccharide deacetylase family protein [Candidatus Krumholzibacteriia bacterium]